MFQNSCAQDYAPACNDIGVAYLAQFNYSQAPDFFLKAIRLGSIVAVENFAYSYANGFGVQKDEVRSHELYIQAAMLGRNAAQIQLAVNYYYGNGVKKDYSQSYAWALVAELDEPDDATSGQAQAATENVRFLLERLLSTSQKEESTVLARSLLAEIEENRTNHIAEFGDDYTGKPDG